MLTVHKHSDKPATHLMGLEKRDFMIWYVMRKVNKFSCNTLVQAFKSRNCNVKNCAKPQYIVLGKTLMNIIKVLNPLEIMILSVQLFDCCPLPSIQCDF